MGATLLQATKTTFFAPLKKKAQEARKLEEGRGKTTGKKKGVGFVREFVSERVRECASERVRERGSS